MSTVTVSSKGQVVLPKKFRDELSIREGDRLEVTREGDHLILRSRSRQGSRDWRDWRGELEGTSALEDHVREHREELADERLP